MLFQISMPCLPFPVPSSPYPNLPNTLCLANCKSCFQTQLIGHLLQEDFSKHPTPQPELITPTSIIYISTFVPLTHFVICSWTCLCPSMRLAAPWRQRPYTCILASQLIIIVPRTLNLFSKLLRKERKKRAGEREEGRKVITPIVQGIFKCLATSGLHEPSKCWGKYGYLW